MAASIGGAARRGTYSIVARDPDSGELGVAVQSHWFGVGAVVAWARPGVGAVATQSVAEVAHGPNALDALARGLSAADGDRRRSCARTSSRATASWASSTPTVAPSRTRARTASRTPATLAARGSRARRT